MKKTDHLILSFLLYPFDLSLPVLTRELSINVYGNYKSLSSAIRQKIRNPAAMFMSGNAR